MNIDKLQEKLWWTKGRCAWMKVQRQNKIMYNSNVWNSRSKYNIIMNVHTNKHENMFKMIGEKLSVI
jgi:hypothetical protein